ncbi:antitoxin [Kitasatospora sp. NPDC091207]|uniref:antitoxin n=1 Tax=Kitasatospora sp. NPDC091207 TaxID=3364083 RepID=UPI0037F41536
MFDGLKNLVDRATGLAREHSDLVGQGLEKVAGVIDDRTDGTYAGPLGTGVEKAKDFIRTPDGDQKPAE